MMALPSMLIYGVTATSLGQTGDPTTSAGVVITLLEQAGLPVGLVLVILWFLWPFMVDQIKRAQDSRDESQREFLKSLHEITSELRIGFEKLGAKVDALGQNERHYVGSQNGGKKT